MQTLLQTVWFPLGNVQYIVSFFSSFSYKILYSYSIVRQGICKDKIRKRRKKRSKKFFKKLLLFFKEQYIIHFVGDNNREEIPVPIPNTEVKLSCAKDTCGLPCWKNRWLPTLYIPLQLSWQSARLLTDRSLVRVQQEEPRKIADKKLSVIFL